VLTEVELVIESITQVFDSLSIPYLIGGSVASGVHGIYRYTNDIDVAADIPEEKVADLVTTLIGYYADEEMIRDGVASKSSFSVIHLSYMVKIDVFLKSADAWTEEVWTRRRLETVSADDSLQAYLPSPEDVVLQKLRWFQMGGGVSDRQWSDILGVLSLQGSKIDLRYMRSWAETLGLSALLEQAIAAALPD